MSVVPTTRSSSVRRSLTTDFDIAKRRAAPVMEPASAMAEKAAMDSSLSIVRLFRNLDRLIIGYRGTACGDYSATYDSPVTADYGRFHVQVSGGPRGRRGSRHANLGAYRSISKRISYADGAGQRHQSVCACRRTR